jgi:hypothetical protein
MKQLTLLITLFSMCNIANGQKFKGQSNLTVGAGYHTSDYIHKVYNNTFKPENLNSPAILLYALNFDMGLSDRISAGFSSSSVNVKSTYSGYTTSTGQAVIAEGSDTYRTFDMGMRLLFHAGMNDDFDPYFGGKLGYGFRNFTTTSNHGFTSKALNNEMGKIVSSQLVAGFRYFFSERFGINIELGLGQTYNGLIGLSYRGGNF